MAYDSTLYVAVTEASAVITPEVGVQALNVCPTLVGVIGCVLYTIVAMILE